MSGSSGTPVRSIGRFSSAYTSAADNQNISSILTGVAWNSASITYSFPTSKDQYGLQANYGGVDPYNGFSPLDSPGHSGQTADALRAIRLVDSYTNLALVQITETTSTHATIRFANTSPSSISTGTAEAYFPSTRPAGGDIFFGGTGENPVMGNFDSAQAMLHEFGHALGLKHGQDNGTFGVMNADRRDIEFSVMNYANYIGSTDAGATAAQSPQSYMMYDIAALQYMYGADFQWANTSVTYSWSLTTGEQFINGVSQGRPFDNHIFATIWDRGSISTYNLSNFSQDQVDDMRPGYWMTFSSPQLADLNANSNITYNVDIYARANIYNALQYNGDQRSLIDNLTTGKGNDRITQNAANNLIDGGLGIDTVIFSSNRSAYTLEDIGGGKVRVTAMTGPDGVDTLVNVERLQFTDQTITWSPSASVADDFADSFSDATSPIGTLALNGSQGGVIEVVGDRDWFRVQLTAGVTYSIGMQGTTGASGALAAPAFRIHNASGVLLGDATYNPISHVSGLTFTPSASGIYYLNAGDYGDQFTGTYRLSLGLANRDPVLTVMAANVTGISNQAIAASSLFKATDADGDTLTYFLYNNTTKTTGGHWVVNGTVVPNDTMYTVTAAQLAQTSFVPGRAGSSDDLLVKVFDGKVYTDWGEFHVNVPAAINHLPVVATPQPNITAGAGQSIAVSSLFKPSDIDGDALTYFLYDSNDSASSGHFVVGGAAVTAKTITPITAAQFTQATFVTGAAGTSDDILVQAFDGKEYSGWNANVHVAVPVANHGPSVITPSGANVSTAANAPIQLSGLFSGKDLDGDTLTYYVYDASPAANSGHVVVGGQTVAPLTITPITAAQLAQATFVAGASGTFDDIYVQAFDGKSYSGWNTGVHIGATPGNHAPLIGLPAGASMDVSAGQSIALASLFRGSDVDGNALSYFVYDANVAANSGHLVVGGKAVAAQTITAMSAAQLAQATFVAGATGTADDIFVQAFDGQLYSGWNAGVHILV